MFYIKQIHNPNKHELMPDDFPWQVSNHPVDSSWIETSLTIEELEAQFDITSYKAATKPVPKAVTPRQMKKALIISGISLATVEGMISSLPSPMNELAMVEWKESLEFQRTNPLLLQLAPNLGLSSQQIDDIFCLAITL